MAADEKTEKATPKKREDERKKGNLFQSNDVVSAFSILAIFLILRMAMPFIYQYLSNTIVQYFTYVKTTDTLSQTFMEDINRGSWIAILLLAGPVMLTSVAVAILAAGVQTKFKFSHEKLKFKFSNISPLQGVKRLFSLRSIVEVLKASIKIAIIGYLIYLKIVDVFSQCADMSDSGIMQSSVNILNDVMDLVIQMSIVFIGIAAVDYFYQWWEYERNIKMTKQEVKEEFKQLEGNPEIKGRIRQLQRSMSKRRMMQQVPTADVIVRNPTHFAVALRYDPEKDEAPVVVAKGQDYVAFKIIEIAEQYHIPMKENRPLARALYASVEVNKAIPPEFYTALAEIMAWVFQMKKEMKR
ncbi:MAG TPA: flagellar biosynthesis protein FlhB [Caproicibacter sp.]|nr:flagellar biosynthesis protein FlhB [Caproicibacter sp.]